MPLFKFLSPDKLIDNDLELILKQTTPADPAKGYVPAYKFKMINTINQAEMGYIDLRIGENENIKYGGHVGYGVDEKFRGHHYAARSIKLLLPFAKQHGMRELWITCNPDNIASRKTCELAGGELVEIVDLPEDNEMYQRGERQKYRYLFE